MKPPLTQADEAALPAKDNVLNTLLDRTLFAQFCNFIPAIAEHLSEYCLCVLAEFGGAAACITRRFAQANRHTHQLSLASYRMIIIDNIFICLHLGVVGQVVNRVDYGVNEIPAFIEDFHPFAARLGKKDVVKNLDQFTAVLASLPHRVKARVVYQRLNPERVAEVLPVFILDHAQADPLLVTAFVMVPQRIEGFVPGIACELMSQDRPAGNVESLQRHHRAEMRGVDLLADTVTLACH